MNGLSVISLYRWKHSLVFPIYLNMALKEKSHKDRTLSDYEIRKKREIEWERKQKLSSATFRRNITGLIGGLCLLIFVFSKIYLFFNPSPWVEYSVEGASDKYQLGFGIWSGKAWGILPASYDDDGKAGRMFQGSGKGSMESYA